MTRRLITLLAMAVLAALLAACGDDDSTAAGEDTVTPATAASGDDEQQDSDDGGGGDAAAVEIVDFSFDPERIEVSTGSTVTWTNEDGVAHTVTAGRPGDAQDTFDRSLEGGGSAEIAFEEAGTFPYFCSIHPRMTGEVAVS